MKSHTTRILFALLLFTASVVIGSDHSSQGQHPTVGRAGSKSPNQSSLSKQTSVPPT